MGGHMCVLNRSVADSVALQTWAVKKQEEFRTSGSGASVIGSTWSTLREMAHEKPWVWALLFVVVALPLFLIIRTCFKRGPKKVV